MTSSKIRVDSKTRLCCLIGHPVAQSPSPIMHNSAFDHLKLNYIYLAFDVDQNFLKTAVEGLKSLDVRGFNVTIPHKVSILRLLDSIDPLAQQIGAVNTVLSNDSSLIGYNTDVYGILEPLKARGVELEGIDVTIFGAGGAARACAVALLNKGCRSITILNRTPSKAKKLLEDLKKQYSFDDRFGDLSQDTVQKALNRSSLVFNATPIGMYPEIEDTPATSHQISSNSMVFDFVYKPVKTTLLKEAEEAGASTIPGYEMLVEQGAASFKIWTGLEPPKDVMKKAVLEELAA